MQIFQIQNATTKQLQWLIWILFYLVTFFSLLPMDGFYQASWFTLINTAFYALIIYGNISLLYPRFYERNRKVTYAIYVLFLLLASGLARGSLISYIYNKYFTLHPENTTFYTILYYCLTGILIFLLSFIFRIAIAYFSLKQKAEEILVEKTVAELNLLKSQVQPHFLFNTLNNIYYEAYLEAPRTAGLIERLSGIMRYFVDESPKAEVLIDTEVNFLENYIALEKIRIRHEISISFVKEYPDNVRIPPMLLMTLVENIFKHGVDKTSNRNQIEISLTSKHGQIVFKTTNRIFPHQGRTTGFGIQNLRKRLELLYGGQFELFTDQSDQFFTAGFKIPIK